MLFLYFHVFYILCILCMTFCLKHAALASFFWHDRPITYVAIKCIFKTHFTRFLQQIQQVPDISVIFAVEHYTCATKPLWFDWLYLLKSIDSCFKYLKLKRRAWPHCFASNKAGSRPLVWTSVPALYLASFHNKWTAGSKFSLRLSPSFFSLLLITDWLWTCVESGGEALTIKGPSAPCSPAVSDLN